MLIPTQVGFILSTEFLKIRLTEEGSVSRERKSNGKTCDADIQQFSVKRGSLWIEGFHWWGKIYFAKFWGLKS